MRVEKIDELLEFFHHFSDGTIMNKDYRTGVLDTLKFIKGENNKLSSIIKYLDSKTKELITIPNFPQYRVVIVNVSPDNRFAGKKGKVVEAYWEKNEYSETGFRMIYSVEFEDNITERFYELQIELLAEIKKEDLE